MMRSIGIVLAAMVTALAFRPVHAVAATNVQISLAFSSAAPDCETVTYGLTGTGDFEFDDLAGADRIAVLWYDGQGHLIDNDFTSLSGPASGFSSFSDFVIASRFVQRPLKVRVFDVGNTTGVSENQPEGVALAVEGTLLAEAQVDPIVDAPACGSRSVGGGLRSETASNGSTQSFSDVTTHTLELATGVSSLRLQLPEPTRVAVFFSAECSVDAADDSSWLDLDLLLDGAALPPTGGGGGDNAFCTSTGSSQLDRWVTARAIGFAELPAGDYQLTATGRLQNFTTGESWWIDDSTVVVQLPEPGMAIALLVGTTGLFGLRRRRGRRGQGLACGLIASVGLLTSISPPQAWAGSQMTSTTETSVQIFTGATQQTIDIGGEFGGGTLALIPIRERSRLVVTFTAECSVAAADSNTWVDIDVTLDGIPLPASDSNDAFCTSTGDSALEHWVSASRIVTTELGRGVYRLMVRGRLIGADPGDDWWIDDVSVTTLAVATP